MAVGRSARWGLAVGATVAAFALPTWLCGVWILASAIPDDGQRWGVASGLGVALAALAALWGYGFATNDRPEFEEHAVPQRLDVQASGTRAVAVGGDVRGDVVTGDRAAAHESTADGTGRGSGSGARISVSGGVVASGVRSVAVGGAVYGDVYTGDVTSVRVPAEELRPAAEVEAPARLVDLPVWHLRFVGRGRELGELEAALAVPGAAVVQAVHGLGGVGKSALAAHYAVAQVQRYNPVWWITSDTPSDIAAGLARFAGALQPTLVPLPQEVLKERAVQWLATHTGWLLILDNVNDPADVKGLLARVHTGHIVITTRRASGWYEIATAMPLDVLTPSEARAQLTAILGERGDGMALDGADELCAELGYLPLAIEQAGAYIAEAGLTPRGYVALLADDPTGTFGQGAEGYELRRTIARIWRVTFDRLADTPLAATVLRVLAWYAPEQIPRSLLDRLGTPGAVREAVRRLAAYSMITAAPESVGVHRLVQALARTPDASDPYRRSQDVALGLTYATEGLNAVAPETWDLPATWPTWRALLPHIEALATHALPESDTEVTASLLRRTGNYLRQQEGLNSRAIKNLERAADSDMRILGPDHPDTLFARNNLATAYRAAGDLAQAIALYEETLTNITRVQGPNHPDTLIARDKLATAYKEAGDLTRAIGLYEQILVDATRVLGPDHPDTLIARNNLASTCEAAGDWVRAIPLHEQTLAERTRLLGPDHPDTLISSNNLAMSYKAAGDLVRAISLHEQTLTDFMRVLGPDHPHTIAVRSNLANAYQATGDLVRAVPLHELTVTERTRVLGPDHPSTLASQNNLASAYNEAGHPTRAIGLYEQTLSDAARILGSDHRITRQAATSLAALRGNTPGT
jgi:tetratricopeptide (TPR) repeat protein